MSPLIPEHNSREFDSERSDSLDQSMDFPTDIVDRRYFIRLMGASMALGGATLSGCRRWPVEEIRPHVSQPEGFVPGLPQFYATCFELDGIATGVLAKCYDGRPIKLEGNPDHPFSLGATDRFAQASILDLYDPERCHQVIERSFEQVASADPASPTRNVRTWEQFQAFAASHFSTLKQRRGAGLAFFLQSCSSPTQARLQSELETAFPQARWFIYQPLHRDHEFEGCRLAFEKPLRPQYDLQRVKVLACFDADLLGSHPAQLKLAHDWSERRKILKPDEMIRLYAIEPSFTLTGAVADLRLPVAPKALANCLAYVAEQLGVLDKATAILDSPDHAWLDNLIFDLRRFPGESLVVAGSHLSPQLQHLAHGINAALQNLGGAVRFMDEPLAHQQPQVDSILELANLLNGSVIETLVILGGNPVYDTFADSPIDLRSRSGRSLTTIHLTSHENETSQQCRWCLPAAHFLECWGDGRAWDGTWSVQQPVIQPLFGGRSAIELLSLINGQTSNSLELVKRTFDTQFPQAGVEGWEQTLHNGVASESQYPLLSITRVTKSPQPTRTELGDNSSTSSYEVCFTGDRKVHDGRFANNAWLQELPDPITKLSWDNSALISKQDAVRNAIRHGDLIRISTSDQKHHLEIAAFVMPGQAVGCMTLPLGYGRKSGGDVGIGVGFDTYQLRLARSSYLLPDVRVTKLDRRYRLATTQLHQIDPSIANVALDYRLGKKGKPGAIVHESTLDEYWVDHHAPHGHLHPVHSAPLFDAPHSFDNPHKWAMTIDLNACLGCSGCVVACQAENNIPVVGKPNVANSREMHWLRIDRYFKGGVDDPDIVHVPVTCAHCETAPCEQVCPVAATVHDTEGLNAMVYNRCIGTRYCANNCPLKVRRFNYLDYHSTHPRNPARPWLGIPDEQQASEVSPLLQLMFNPDVTVRMRGVMEKCTYCVQRIVAARINARNQHAVGKRETNLVKDGEIQTACQNACPTNAIQFGDLNDPDSKVSQARNDDRHYEILEELNLRSRTTHLAKIRNRPNGNDHD